MSGVWKPEVLDTHPMPSHGGTLLMVHCDIETPRDKSGLFGRVVEWNGERYAIAGVEAFALATPIRAGERIGILVKEPLGSTNEKGAA